MALSEIDNIDGLSSTFVCVRGGDVETCSELAVSVTTSGSTIGTAVVAEDSDRNVERLLWTTPSSDANKGDSVLETND
jgi:hypothetical protein